MERKAYYWGSYCGLCSDEYGGSNHNERNPALLCGNPPPLPVIPGERLENFSCVWEASALVGVSFCPINKIKKNFALLTPVNPRKTKILPLKHIIKLG